MGLDDKIQAIKEKEMHKEGQHRIIAYVLGGEKRKVEVIRDVEGKAIGQRFR